MGSMWAARLRGRAEVGASRRMEVPEMAELTATQTAELHGVGKTQILNAIREGRLRARRFGSVYVIERESAERFVPRRPGRPLGRKDSEPRVRRTRMEMAG